MNKYYYIIKQELPYLKPKTLKLQAPINIEQLKILVSSLVGDIKVYYYNSLDNSRKDITKEFEFERFDINKHNPQKFEYKKYYFYKDGFYRLIVDFYIYDSKQYFKAIKLTQYGYEFLRKASDYSSIEVFASDISSQAKKDIYGNEYEIFIAKKYEKAGYNVVLNGINKKVKDGGIDLVATKNDSIVLIQCKNWSLSNEYKVNQKDLRAFIGDGFIFMKNKNLLDKKVSFHFLVSHDNILNAGAIKFLEFDDTIKFKCVPFEKECF